MQEASATSTRVKYEEEVGVGLATWTAGRYREKKISISRVGDFFRLSQTRGETRAFIPRRLWCCNNTRSKL